MRAGALLEQIEAFQRDLSEHQRLWGASLDQRIPRYPGRNVEELQQQSRQLSRTLGRLRPFLNRTTQHWYMQIAAPPCSRVFR